MDHLLTYLSIFIILVGESTIVVGAFVPGFNTAITAAFLASAGRLNIGLVFLATWLGIFVGDYIGYLIGRHGIDRLRSVRRLISRVRRPIEKQLDRHPRLLICYQFIGFGRAPLPIFFGAIRRSVRWWTFLLLRATTLLTIVMVFGSYLLGNVVGKKTALRIAAVSQIIATIMVLVVLIQTVRRRRKRVTKTV